MANPIQDIHSFWAATSSITDVLPANRFFTGLVGPEVVLPYAVLVPIASVPRFTVGKSFVETFTFQIDIYSTSLAEAASIAEAVKDAFDAATVAANGMGTQRRNSIVTTETQEREGETVLYRYSLVYDYFANDSQP